MNGLDSKADAAALVGKNLFYALLVNVLLVFVEIATYNGPVWFAVETLILGALFVGAELVVSQAFGDSSGTEPER